MRQYEVQNGIDKRHFKIPQHIEVQHATFEIEDLKKLIKTTSKDLVRISLPFSIVHKDATHGGQAYQD